MTKQYKQFRTYLSSISEFQPDNETETALFQRYANGTRDTKVIRARVTGKVVTGTASEGGTILSLGAVIDVVTDSDGDAFRVNDYGTPEYIPAEQLKSLAPVTDLTDNQLNF